jgi:integrase
MAAVRKRGSKWQARVKRNGQTLDKSFLTKADAQRWERIESDNVRGCPRQVWPGVHASEARRSHRVLPHPYADEAHACTWIQPIVIMAIETAMRRGEILSLRWENIDLAKRVAHLPMTKNGTSRDVPLSLRAVQTLQLLPRSITGVVFPISANALKLAFKRGLSRARRLYEQHGQNVDAKMFVNLRFHDLRHEGTTRLPGTTRGCQAVHADSTD